MATSRTYNNEALVKAAQQGDEAALETLIADNEALITSCCVKLRGRADWEDLRQYAYLGFLKAVRSYDCTRNCKFSTYVTTSMGRELFRAVDNNVLIHIPPWVITLNRKYFAVFSRLQGQLDRDPTMDEVAAEMGMSTKRLQSVIKSQDIKILSLDKYYEDGFDLEEVGKDEAFENLFNGYSDILLVIEKLDQQSQIILKARYGLDDGNVLPLEEIAEIVGMSREGVRQIERRAIRRIRRLLGLEEPQPCLM